MMAPVVVKLIPKIGAKKMIVFAAAIIGIAMWRYGSLDPGTDYKTYALARVLQGVGLGFFFVPVSALAYSYLPLNKNNKASSITNLFRNLGGSFGVAFVTTLLERRTQFHHSVIVQNLTPENPAFRQSLDATTQYMISMGASTADAAQQAYAQISALANQQAALQGFLDCFHALGWVAFATMIVALAIKPFRGVGGTTEH
jgi:DHA2 family multidrug resistance protein